MHLSIFPLTLLKQLFKGLGTVFLIAAVTYAWLVNMKALLTTFKKIK